MTRVACGESDTGRTRGLWTPWQYAGETGRFTGRWDDPRGSFRTVYAGRELVACLLEVLARFRPDPLLEEDLSGVYCEVTDKESMACLRATFLPAALRYGLADLDAGALRLSVPRALTQQIAAWLYDLHDGSRVRVDGVQFQSRHGDDLTLWAVFERDDDRTVSARITGFRTIPLHPKHPDLLEAFRLHRLGWAD